MIESATSQFLSIQKRPILTNQKSVYSHFFWWSEVWFNHRQQGRDETNRNRNVIWERLTNWLQQPKRNLLPAHPYRPPFILPLFLLNSSIWTYFPPTYLKRRQGNILKFHSSVVLKFYFATYFFYDETDKLFMNHGNVPIDFLIESAGFSWLCELTKLYLVVCRGVIETRVSVLKCYELFNRVGSYLQLQTLCCVAPREYCTCYTLGWLQLAS